MLNNPRVRWAAVLGFALGGFFDGILLHQILQWHHLLSLVPKVDSIRLQVLWDGYFHALNYLIAAFSLCGLWRNRAGIEQMSGYTMWGAVLIGFALWHVVDGVLSHWVLGIHRIKLDSPDPLLWDLIWLAGFGIAPLLVGSLMLRNPSRPKKPTRSTPSILAIGLLTTGAGLWAAQPPLGQRFTTVVFSATVSPGQALDAVRVEGGALVWSDPSMSVLVVDVPEERLFNFYRHGALLVSGAGTAGGCLDWSAA